MVTVTALILPAVLILARGGSLPPVGVERQSFSGQAEHFSIGVSVVMIAIYLAGPRFSLRTHRDLFRPGGSNASSYS